MSANTFYVILPSNTASYSSNKSNKFKVQLPRKLRFEGPGWMVGLASIIYPNSWASIGGFERQYILVHLENGTKFRLPLPKGSYLSPEQLERSLHSGMVSEFERQLRRKVRNAREVAATSEERPFERVPIVPLTLTQSEHNWIMARRKKLKQDLTAQINGDEQALVGKLRETSHQLKISPLSADEWGALKTRRAEMNREVDRTSFTFDDIEFIMLLRAGQASAIAYFSHPSPQPPTSQTAQDMPTYAGIPIPDLAPWPLHKWLLLRAGKDPHVRLRHLLDKNPLVYELALNAYEEKYKAETSWKDNLQEHIEAHLDEFEEMYQKIDYNEQYTKMPEHQKTLLLDYANSIRFKWNPSIGRFVLHITDAASLAVAYVTLTEQIAHVLGFEPDEMLNNESQAKYAPDLHGGVSHLCVYMNSGLIESVIMGDRFAQLLQIIAVDGAPGAVVQKDFLPPIFHRVVAQETDVIDIEIRTMGGRYLFI